MFPEYEYYNDMPPNQRVLDTFNNLTFPPLDITTNITIQRIFDISDDKSAFSVIFQVELEWNDLNLKFNYLSDSTNVFANTIGPQNWTNMWKPNLSFSTLTGTAKSPKILDEEILIKKGSEASLTNNIETLFHRETYEGATNSIYYKRIYQGQFMCEFDGVSQYPVGKNLCHVRMYLRGIANKMTKLKLLPLNVASDKEVGEYIVNKYFLQDAPRNQLNTIVVSFELLRSRTSIILVTYLPTILMNMINQVKIAIYWQNI